MAYYDYLDESERQRVDEAMGSALGRSLAQLKPGIRYAGGDDVVFFAPLQDYRTYALALIGRYDKQSTVKRRLHNALQITIFTGAALITAAVALEGVPKFVPVLLGATVALATALANFYKFGERSRTLYLTAERMALEYNRFDTRRGLYKGLEEKAALDLFMDRIEVMLHEDTRRRFAAEQVADEQRMDVSREGKKS